MHSLPALPGRPRAAGFFYGSFTPTLIASTRVVTTVTTRVIGVRYLSDRANILLASGNGFGFFELDRKLL